MLILFDLKQPLFHSKLHDPKIEELDNHFVSNIYLESYRIHFQNVHSHQLQPRDIFQHSKNQ